jgi:hypothetical protein
LQEERVADRLQRTGWGQVEGQDRELIHEVGEQAGNGKAEQAEPEDQPLAALRIANEQAQSAEALVRLCRLGYVNFLTY